MKTFGQFKKILYLCRIDWKSRRGATAVYIDKKDVIKRLSCWNINFAKVKTITDGATKRLRGTSCCRANIGVFPPMRLLRYLRAGVGIAIVAYPDG